ncbi:XAC2610-related protein [Myroides odoratimimus]|uniref:XAC2610-related protein n=1 Tax=Myroides odoratimimus TaxID=76832 RepID=UPI0031017E3B
MKSKIIIMLLSVVLVTISCKKKIEEFPNTTTEEVVLVDEEWDDVEEDEYDNINGKGWYDISVLYVYNFTGYIDDIYAFDMQLFVSSEDISGKYYYLSKEKNIRVEGTLKDGHLKLTEEFGNTFKGVFDYEKGTIKGEWSNITTGAVMPFSMANPKGKGYPWNKYKAYMVLEGGSDDTYTVMRLAEIDKNGKVKFKSITSSSRIDGGEEPDFPITLQDYNFDGYLDICAFEFYASYPPNKYQYLLYDSKEDDYVFNQEFDNEIYSEASGTNFRKNLIYETTEGPRGSSDIFQVINGKIKVVYSWYNGGYPNEDGEIEGDTIPYYFKYNQDKQIEITKEEFEKIYGLNALGGDLYY